MKYNKLRFDEITLNYDKKRIPLSAMERTKRQGAFRYFGAQGVIDYVDDYIFDGKYLLIAEDGENLQSKRQNIAQIVEGKFWVNNHAHIVQCNEKCILEYLAYLINSKDVSGYITGSAQPKLSQANLNAMEFDIPSIKEQQNILSILLPIEQKIRINNAINNNLLEQLNQLFAEFSTRCEWDNIPIGEIAEKVAMGPFGSNIKVSTFVESGVPIISGNHLRGYFLEEPSYNYITEEHAEKLKNSIVYPKDIVFTHAGNIGQVAMIPVGCEYPYYVLSQRQFYLRCNTDVTMPEYVLLFFHSKQGQYELLSYANQTGVPSIAQPASNLKKICLPIPPIEEQENWLSVVEPIIAMYQNSYQETKRLSALRDTLLPRLMSAELDVSDIDL